MIRSTSRVPSFGLWREAAVLNALAFPRYLTIGRYEPILFRKFGSGQVDLLLESAHQSCVLAGLRLDPNNLLLRERSAVLWPVDIAAIVDHEQLRSLEGLITPWLRSLARGRAMASESIRRFAPSARFDRARAAELVGAAPLNRTIPRMAPFVYARRFAKGSTIVLTNPNAALGQAILKDVAASINRQDTASEDDAFARDWYGVTLETPVSFSIPDLVIADQRATFDAPVVIETVRWDGPAELLIDVPAPVPWDLLFSFDSADAPASSQFAVIAREPPLRDYVPVETARAVGGSAGTIVLAVSPEAFAMHGTDIEEVELLGRLLAAEGLDVRLVWRPADPLPAGAQLVHIFGAPGEAHTLAFAEAARNRDIEYIFDVISVPSDRQANAESLLFTIFRAALDEHDVDRYMHAYEECTLEAPSGTEFVELTPAEYAQHETRFAELALSAAAVLTSPEDRELLLARLPGVSADRICVRGNFAEVEPPAAAIGHLIPSIPFAFMHAPLALQSHCLYAAFAAERHALPMVIAGPVHDVDFLHVLRGIAPSAIVLADASAGVVSALYRRAAVFVDAAPRPRSAAALLRALACGAFPVLARDSPLARVIGSGAAVFSLRSIDDCGRVIGAALSSPDRAEQLEQLCVRLMPRRRQQSSLGAIIAAYSRVAAPA